jgi:hypothetical protein
MRTGREGYGHLLFDFPSDHEVDAILPTACETIRAVLCNRTLKSRLKIHRCSSINSFRKLGKPSYQAIRFVHLSGHGSKDGIHLIGGIVKWKDLAIMRRNQVGSLHHSQQRVLSLSPCSSRYGANEMASYLQGFFYWYVLLPRRRNRILRVCNRVEYVLSPKEPL